MKEELGLALNPKREYFLDILRILACFFVVMRHSIVNWIGPSLDNYFNWHAGLVYYGIVYSAIPLFLMITGYLMLGKIESYSDFFNKRLLKIGLPFLAWSLIFYYYGNIYCDMGMGNFIKVFLSRPVFYHLWYVYMLFGIYLAMPLVRKMVSRLTKFDFKYLLGIWVFLGGLMPLITKKFGVTIGISYLFSEYWGYVLLGHFLKQIEVKKSHLKFYFEALVVGFLITLMGTTWLTSRYNRADDFFLNLFLINVVLVAIGLFMIFKYLDPWFKKVLSDRWKKIIVTVSDLTLGIYLSHVLIMDIFLRHFFGLTWGPTSMNPILGIPIFSLAIFGITLLLVYILSRIPVLKLFV